jgi:abequosyltransferase
MSDFLLSITIPTYNRAGFLKRSLEYLYLQKEDIANNIEIIVSDNASTDNTREIVQHFIDLGLKIVYIRNVENKGPDFNVAQCYKMAKGQYVLALGDDDLILLSGVKSLVRLLSSGDEYGIVYLSSYPLLTKEVPEFDNEHIRYTIYNNYKDFILKETYYVTFISGNIINRKYVCQVNLDLYFNTNLSQVPLILTAILNSSKNVYVYNGILASQIENSSGYNFLKVFGINFMKIINEQQKKSPDKTFKNLFESDLILTFLPYAISLLRSTDHQFEVDWSIKEDLANAFKRNYYYLLVKPFFYLPVPILKWYRIALVFFSRFNKFCIIRPRNRTHHFIDV